MSKSNLTTKWFKAPFNQHQCLMFLEEYMRYYGIFYGTMASAKHLAALKINTEINTTNYTALIFLPSIPGHNGAKWVKRCKGSVSHQRRDPEVIERRHLLLKNWYFASEEEKCERTWKTTKWSHKIKKKTKRR